MTTEQFNALTALKGKRQYEGVIYDFTHFKELSTGTNIVVYSKSRTFNLLRSDVDDFLNSLEEVTEARGKEIALPPPAALVTFPVPVENADIRSVLLDTLRLLKDKPTKDVMDQSAAIVNVTNSLINLQKVEIQIHNIQKRINGSR